MPVTRAGRGRPRGGRGVRIGSDTAGTSSQAETDSIPPVAPPVEPRVGIEATVRRETAPGAEFANSMRSMVVDLLSGQRAETQALLAAQREESRAQIEQLTRLFQQGAAAPPAPQEPAAFEAEVAEGADELGKWLKDFVKWNPDKFDATGDALAAARWIAHLEYTFLIMVCPDVQRPRCAAHVLGGVARWWWESTLSERPAGSPPATWEFFKSEFKAKYISDEAQEKMVALFQNLKQGSDSIEEYERKFSEYGYFAPQLIATPELKIRKFISGLRQGVSQDVRALAPITYAKAVQLATIYNGKYPVERTGAAPVQRPVPAVVGQKRRFEFRGGGQRRQGQFQNRDQRRIPAQFQPRQQGGPRQTPTCATCGRAHFEACQTGAQAVFQMWKRGSYDPFLRSASYGSSACAAAAGPGVRYEPSGGRACGCRSGRYASCFGSLCICLV